MNVEFLSFEEGELIKKVVLTKEKYWEAVKEYYNRSEPLPEKQSHRVD